MDVLAVIWLVLAGAVGGARAAGTASCDTCSWAGDGACGANGVTYANECLLLCSGTTLVAPGPCGTPNPFGLVGKGGAAGARGTRLRDDAIGRLMSASAAAADDGGDEAAPPPTARDFSRFASEGFVLVGLADAAGPQAGRSKVCPECDNTPGASASWHFSRRSTLYRVRVTPGDGRLYVHPQPLALRELAAGQRRATNTLSQPPAPEDDGDGAATNSSAATGVGGVAGTPPGLMPLAAPSGVAGDGPASATVAGPRRGAGGGLSALEWARITSRMPSPFTSIGRLDAVLSSGFKEGCSGAMIGRYAALTAAHCIFNVRSKSSLASANFTPHKFCNSPSGAACGPEAFAQPFGRADVVAGEFLAGWQRGGAWRSDMAVLLMTSDLGSRAGWFGLGYDYSGVRGEVHTAGYPSASVVAGEFYRLKGTCTIRDTNGQDGKVNLRSFPASPSTSAQPVPGGQCWSACGIGEQGQSGQPLWIEPAPGIYVIRGVLSRGPEPGTCNGYDTYTEVDWLHYSHFVALTMWVPS